MRDVQEQPVNNASEYKDIKSKVDKLMSKINSKKVQDQEGSETPTPSKPKGTTKKYSRAQGYDNNGYPIIYCHTHGISCNLAHVSMNCDFPSDTQKKKQPFSTRWMALLLPTNPNPRNYKLRVT